VPTFQSPSDDVKDDIRTAVIRFEVDAPTDQPAIESASEKNSVARTQRDTRHEIYFVEVGETGAQDPSDGLLARFASHQPQVKRYSESKIESKAIPELNIDENKASMMYHVRDKATGKIGASLHIRRILLTGPNRAEVDGSLHSGGLYGAGYIWIAVCENGHWTIKRRRTTWMS